MGKNPLEPVIPSDSSHLQTQSLGRKFTESMSKICTMSTDLKQCDTLQENQNIMGGGVLKYPLLGARVVEHKAKTLTAESTSHMGAGLNSNPVLC